MITHIVSDWLFSPCCVEHQDEFIFEKVAVAYSRDYNEVGRAQIKPSFFYFLFYRFFLQQVRVGERNKNKNKIHSDHFPIELKSKET